MDSFLFAKVNHKYYWKCLPLFNRERKYKDVTEIENFDWRSRSEEYSYDDFIKDEGVIIKEEGSDQTLKSKRTVKTMGDCYQRSDQSDLEIYDIERESQSRGVMTRKRKKEKQRRMEDKGKKKQNEWKEKLFEMIDESSEPIVNITVNKTNWTFSKANKQANIEVKEKFKWRWLKGKPHKSNDEWQNSLIRSTDQREIIKKEIMSPLDPFSKDVYENLIPDNLKKDIQTIDINLPEYKWAKEFAWMNSSWINQFKILAMMEDEVKKRLEYIKDNPDQKEPKFTSKDELYIKDLAVFIWTKLDSCFPSIVTRCPKTKWTDENVKTFNEKWERNLKNMYANFIWSMRLLLKRSAETDRLKQAYINITSNNCENK